MSASSWATCPQCQLRHSAAASAARTDADQSYGLVPAETFRDMQRLAEEKAQPLSEATFREDYEIYGAATGVITVSYGAGCTECGLSVSFTHKVEIPVTEAQS